MRVMEDTETIGGEWVSTAEQSFLTNVGKICSTMCESVY